MYSRVYVEITNICNKSCSFCHGHKREPRRMSREEFCSVLERLDGVTKYIYYHLMGEPLTHPMLPDFIKIAAGRGFKSVITTNGTLLGALGQSLIDSGVYKVNISLHSFEGERDADFTEYISECLDFADKASRAGVLVILRLWNSGYDGGKNQRIVEMMKKRFSDGEWAEAPDGARIRHKLHLEYGERFKWPDVNEREHDGNVFCYALSDHFGILCDGTVVPCCLDSDGELALGNIFTAPIEQILSLERAENIQSGFKKHTACEPLCRRCGYARRFK